ncbi:NIPA-like protein 2 isoform X1 [Hemiscyllium ocellatum]|uniref:NIPA-like protein 2 isoform X1 n=1 Tax=Hemiscyllium ocellatum TaxID=170820 RepID=UPI0029660CB3|nr:NIPA-like protein 2 isoform X1 [Hemiscyllium ocellatum]
MASAVSVATPLELVPNVSERQNSTLSPTWSNLHPYQTNILGTVLAITGNVLISISLNVQKYSHIRLLCQESRTPYYKSKLWWCGILLMGMGELGNFAAYGFAPATLVAPLGCVSVIASAAISVVFLKEILRSSDILGGSLAVLGTYLLVTFAINVQQEITGPKINLYIISWPFLVYLTLEFILFVILLYLFKRRGMNHIVILLLMSSILASLTVISVKAVSGMVTSSIQGQLQFQYPIFYVMLVVMIASCIFQVQFLNQAMRLYNATEVVPINFVFFTTSAIIAGVIFYQEFHGAALLNIFMFLFGCLLSFLGVFLIAKNRVKQTPEVPYIDMGPVPKQRSTEKIQPGLNNINSYGSVHDEEQTNDSLSEDVK